MPRPILDEAHLHPVIRERVAAHGQNIVQEVQAAAAGHAVVVADVRANPSPAKARRLLDAAGTAACRACWRRNRPARRSAPRSPCGRWQRPGS